LLTKKEKRAQGSPKVIFAPFVLFCEITICDPLCD